MDGIVRLGRVLALCSCVFVSVTYPATPQSKESPDTPAKIVVNVNRVLLPVVVRDKQGRAVGNLQKDDFKVFDNDRPQVISAFTVQNHVSPEIHPANAESAKQAAPPLVAPLQSPAPAQRFVVFYFDDMHLSTEELVAAEKAGMQALTSALADSDMAAVVSTSGKTNSGLTRDRAALKNAIMTLQLRGVYRSNGADCPNIDYYQADLIENKHDSAALQDATRQVLNCNPGMNLQDIGAAERLADSAARRALTLDHLDVQATYASMEEFVRRMAALPGQRLLILVSPGFLPVEQDSLSAESQVIDLANRSNVTISALDARGLYTTELDASQHSPSLMNLNGAGGSVQLQSDYRRSSMLLAEGAMESLADGTGGMFFHNSNDLGAGLKDLTAIPEFVYVLEFSPDEVKASGTYHRLKVRVERDGLQVQARRGYFVPKADKKK
jgi:VWFA-related protein